MAQIRCTGKTTREDAANNGAETAFASYGRARAFNGYPATATNPSAYATSLPQDTLRSRAVATFLFAIGHFLFLILHMPKIVRFHQVGDASVLKLEELPKPQPKEGEVLLKVEAIGLNRAEVMFRSGQYLDQPNFPSLIGYEAAGIVEAVGPGVTGLKPGDRVSSIPSFPMTEYGTYGEYVVLPAYALARYPDNLSPVEGTSIWMQYLTAYGVVEFGGLKKGQHLLITAAASSVGLAAIQTAKAVGAISIATTRNKAKASALSDAGADFVINTKSEDLVQRVNEITDGKGFPLAFDPVAGPGLETLAKAAGEGAMIIEYGALAPEPTPYPLFAAISKGLTIRGYTLFEINADPERQGRAKKFILDKLADGTFRPIVAKTFKLDEIVQAHRYMESNEQIGKIVVTV
jgi:NADPH:quinone reductase-like Zn-dependent oxidoreductase